MRVVGVDPGTIATGWGVIDGERERLRFVAGGVVRARGELPQRLAEIHRVISEVIAEYLPGVLSLEKSFVGDNVQSALRLGEARGAILAAAASANVAVAEYSPAEIKLAVAGGGRATKEQVQWMVAQLLGVDGERSADEADALGAAICHLQTRRFADLVGVASTPARSGRGRISWRSGGRR